MQIPAYWGGKVPCVKYTTIKFRALTSRLKNMLWWVLQYDTWTRNHWKKISKMGDSKLLPPPPTWSVSVAFEMKDGSDAGDWTKNFPSALVRNVAFILPIVQLTRSEWLLNVNVLRGKNVTTASEQRGFCVWTKSERASSHLPLKCEIFKGVKRNTHFKMTSTSDLKILSSKP